MRTSHLFSIAALVTLLLVFIFFPISDSAADGGSIQTVQGTVGSFWCPPIGWPYTSSERGICGHEPCYPFPTAVAHTFVVTPDAELTVETSNPSNGCGNVGFLFRPTEACTLLSSDFWTQNYTCTAPDSGQLIITAVGTGSYKITVTELEIINPPAPPVVVPFETPIPAPPIITTPDPEKLAGVQRINQWSAIPYVVYVPTAARAAAENTQFIDIWHLDENGIGQPLLYVSKEQLLALPATPAENLLIATSPDGVVNVYKLTTGEYQVNIGLLKDGKVYTTIFDGIPPTTVRHSTTVSQ